MDVKATHFQVQRQCKSMSLQTLHMSLPAKCRIDDFALIYASVYFRYRIEFSFSTRQSDRHPFVY